MRVEVTSIHPYVSPEGRYGTEILIECDGVPSCSRRWDRISDTPYARAAEVAQFLERRRKWPSMLQPAA